MVRDNFILFYSLVAEKLARKPREWYVDRRRGISKEIRPMTEEERERAKEREEANNGE